MGLGKRVDERTICCHQATLEICFPTASRVSPRRVTSREPSALLCLNWTLTPGTLLRALFSELASMTCSEPSCKAELRRLAYHHIQEVWKRLSFSPTRVWATTWMDKTLILILVYFFEYLSSNKRKKNPTKHLLFQFRCQSIKLFFL